MRNSKKLSYAQAIKELEGIIQDIETENTDVDLLTKKVKRAAYLINICKNNLRTTEEEVKKILSEIEEKAEVEENQDKDRDVF